MKMDMNLHNIDSYAAEYVIDLIERDFKENQGNSVRGGTLFQEVWWLAGRMRDAVLTSKQEELSARRRERGTVGVV